MALIDRAGRLVNFAITPGNAAENLQLPGLMEGVEAGELLADKAYDTDDIRKLLSDNGIAAIIPPKSNRVNPPAFSPQRYRSRHRVENLFVDLKHFRSIATRYCKLGDCYASFISLVRWVIETRPTSRASKVQDTEESFGPIVYWRQAAFDFGDDNIFVRMPLFPSLP